MPKKQILLFVSDAKQCICVKFIVKLNKNLVCRCATLVLELLEQLPDTFSVVMKNA